MTPIIDLELKGLPPPPPLALNIHHHLKINEISRYNMLTKLCAFDTQPAIDSFMLAIGIVPAVTHTHTT